MNDLGNSLRLDETLAVLGVRLSKMVDARCHRNLLN